MMISYKYMKLALAFAIFFAVPTVANSQTLLDKARQDLVASQKKLTEQRTKLADERIEVSAGLTKNQAELLEKRRLVRIARMSGQERREALRFLRLNASEQGDEVEFLQSQLKSFSLKQQTLLVKGEKTEDIAGKGIELTMQNLEAGVARLEKMLGGTVIEVEGVSDEGLVKPGKLAMVGPAMWFQADDGSFGGDVVLAAGSRSAQVVGGDAEIVSKLSNSEEVIASVDLTGGKARALANIDESPLDLFRKGGSWVWPIMAVALIALICAMLKFIQLSKIDKLPNGWLQGVLENLRNANATEAATSCNGIPHPIGEVMEEALTGYDKGADVVEEIVYEKMIGVQSNLQKWLPFIAVTAAIAPLLGLLGTVSGMITTFNVITVAGTGDPKPLAGGISEALVTTMFGLVVAIPALVLHALLSRRSQGIIQTTEKLGLTIVNCIRKNKN